ncbi:MAG TPA: hypothetical protein VMO47_17520 [Rhodothermales bacterium]|nr:hypothetical protein [Rhodothermales bacterium]
MDREWECLSRESVEAAAGKARFRLLIPALALGLGATVYFTSTAAAEERKKTRDELVQDDLSAWGEDDDAWIYNDLPVALAEANRSGKPIMAVLRCIP